MNILSILSNVISPITNVFKQREVRKQAEQDLKYQLDRAKVDGNFQLQLTDQQWELLSKQNEDSTWKDEFVTIVFVSPVIFTYLAAFISAYTGNPIYIESINVANDQIQMLLGDTDSKYSEIAYAVVLAAIGIKALNKTILNK